MTPSPSDAGRQRYLDYHARCQQAFTPFAPIQLPDFFAGRLEVIRRVHDELEAPGRQVAIFGERGVGKTSLSALLSFFTGFRPEKTHVVRCGQDDTFETIFFEFLHWHGTSLALEAMESEGGAGGQVSLGPLQASGERRQRRSYRASSHSQTISKARLLRTFADEEALLIVDEYDRIRDSETHTRTAELIKAFSDSHSSSKIVVVGVADSLRELIGEHTSLSRSLAQVKLDRMSPSELTEILRRGEERTQLTFGSDIVRRIVSLADGFPHYVHLIGLYASLQCIQRLLDEPEALELRVGDEEYAVGVERAIQNSEHSLVEGYEDAVITTRRRSDKYELILQAIAMGDEPVAQVQDIARHASTLARREVKPGQLSTALGRLTRDEKGEVLTKVRDGYYKFTNPLMRAYVRLLLDHRFRGQMPLPFFD